LIYRDLSVLVGAAGNRSRTAKAQSRRALTQGPLIEAWPMKNDFQPVVGLRFNPSAAIPIRIGTA
jgi:hypothetical protein